MPTNKVSVDDQMAVIRRGVSEILDEKRLREKLSEGRPLVVKLGVDPTAPDIHLGFTVVMRKLRQLQDLGHRIVLIVGDYTATIGDPTGKQSTRVQMDHDKVIENARTYQEQFFKIVDREKTTVMYNGEWFSKMSFSEIAGLLSQITVAQMLERQDFQNRHYQGKPISLHEFMYPMMQAYDSVRIKADIELGGTDQKFNVIRGIDMQTRAGQNPQVGIFMPILLGLDGRKMSKSYGNYVGITESPRKMYHKIYNINDEQIEQWVLLLTDLNLEKVMKLKPREQKSLLAKTIIAQYHGKEAAEKAELDERGSHSGRSIPEDAIEYHLTGKSEIISLLIELGAYTSRTEAKNAIGGGAVKVDGIKIDDVHFVVAPKKHSSVKVGQDSWYRLV